MTLCSVSDSPRAEFGNTDCLSLLNQLPTSLWVKFSTDISKIHSAPFFQIDIDPSKLLPSVQFSRSVVSNSLRPHEPQHARPPYPSPTPRVYPNPCPLSQWCHPTISSSVVPFSSCLQSFPASGSFQMSQLFTSGGLSIGVSASTSVLPMNNQSTMQFHCQLSIPNKLNACCFKEDLRQTMLLNCGVGEDAWESFGLQGDPTSPS